ncbi:MAG: hypothetical protein IJD97_06925 [Clostridia bacterium]|nr:hypothetical protein [Clostridia bacterium]
MNKNIKNKITVFLFALFILAFSLSAIFMEKDRYTKSERRALAEFPEISGESILSGEFSSEFEKYATDNFPLRDVFRKIKNSSELYIFGKQDTNGLYLKDGHISKIEYPESEKMMENAANRITAIYETYLKDTAENIYVSVIPDKGKFLAEDKLSLDYEGFEERFLEKVPFATPITISDLLTKDDYYKTDSHWRQEKIIPVAERLLSGMGKSLTESFTENKVKDDFYGVYAGQSAFYSIKDEIVLLESESIKGATVTSYDTGKPVKKAVYTMDELESADPYEVYLSGADALLVIENPASVGKGHLVIFRDSFTSSLAPLLISEYEKITLADTRYIAPSLVVNFVDFEGADVLFLYSTSIINNSGMLK